MPPVVRQTYGQACLTALPVTCISWTQRGGDCFTILCHLGDLCCHAWPRSRDFSVSSGGFRLEKWEVEEKSRKTQEEETCVQGKYVHGFEYVRARVHENDPCALAFHQGGTCCGLRTVCWQWGASVAEQGRGSAAFLQEVPTGVRGQKDQLCTPTPTPRVSGAEFASLGWSPLFCWALRKNSLEPLVILVDTRYCVDPTVWSPDCQVVQAAFLCVAFGIVICVIQWWSTVSFRILWPRKELLVKACAFSAIIASLTISSANDECGISFGKESRVPPGVWIWFWGARVDLVVDVTFEAKWRVCSLPLCPLGFIC